MSKTTTLTSEAKREQREAAQTDRQTPCVLGVKFDEPLLSPRWPLLYYFAGLSARWWEKKGRTDTDWNEIRPIDHFSISNLELLFRYLVVVERRVGWKRGRRDLPRVSSS